MKHGLNLLTDSDLEFLKIEEKYKKKVGRPKLEPTVVISERVKARFQHEIRFKIKELIKKHYHENERSDKSN